MLFSISLITSVCILHAATVFGQNLRLAPLKPEKKALWKREMDCLLSVCDYIVEFISESQNLRDGREVEVNSGVPRPKFIQDCAILTRF